MLLTDNTSRQKVTIEITGKGFNENRIKFVISQNIQLNKCWIPIIISFSKFLLNSSVKVLHKVNTELMFARTELDAALEKQTGDINEARKRVMWLEDRMGLLCGKVRMRVS